MSSMMKSSLKLDMHTLKKKSLNGGHSNFINDKGHIVRKNTNTQGWKLSPTKGWKIDRVVN
jgi:hypothetical protein